MTVTRRLVLAGGAAASALYATPHLASAFSAPEPVIWRGQALGAPAKIILYHPDQHRADRLIRNCVREASRFEDIFSLYKQDSELSRLNRAGALAAPSPELIDLLSICRTCWELSDGLFDPTVQPLWDCLKQHFSQPSADPAGPSQAVWDKALTKVGFGRVLFDDNRIVFAKPSMALTLNGIAQGYISDQVADLLRSEGVEHALVDMVEYRALGGQPDGKPWRIGISRLEATSKVEAFIDIVDQGLATSSFAGFQFEKSGQFNHLLNPKTGYSASLYEYLTVVSRDAARADAWATAFNLMEEQDISATLQSQPDMAVFARRRDGEHFTLNAPAIIPVSF